MGDGIGPFVYYYGAQTHQSPALFLAPDGSCRVDGLSSGPPSTLAFHFFCDSWGVGLAYRVLRFVHNADNSSSRTQVKVEFPEGGPISRKLPPCHDTSLSRFPLAAWGGKPVIYDRKAQQGR